jgi:hypothetical protein
MANPRSKKPRVEVIYPVYRHHHVMGHAPLFWVDKPTKLWMLAEGSAKSFDSGKALKLLINILKIRGTSCQMGPKVIERAAMGSKTQQHLAMTAAASYR